MANDNLVEVPSTDYYFQHFRDAFTHTYLKFMQGEAKEAILNFCGTNVIGIAMFYSFTPDQLAALVDLTFKSNHIRDFVLTLASTYHMRIDRGGREWDTLVDRLALSYNVAAAQTATPQYRVFPDVYADRLPNEADIKGYLAANRWLLVMCMIDQCITLGDVMQLAGVKTPKAK